MLDAAARHGFTWSEQHRHECEVRYVVKLQGSRSGYLAGVLAKRGQAAADRLADDVRAALRGR